MLRRRRPLVIAKSMAVIVGLAPKRCHPRVCVCVSAWLAGWLCACAFCVPGCRPRYDYSMWKYPTDSHSLQNDAIKMLSIFRWRMHCFVSFRITAKWWWRTQWRWWWWDGGKCWCWRRWLNYDDIRPLRTNKYLMHINYFICVDADCAPHSRSSSTSPVAGFLFY